MKLFKFGLRIWLTVASAFIFVTSWMMFSHSPKPVQSPDVPPAPTLAPLPPMQGSTKNATGIFSLLTQNNAQPRRRSSFITGGS